MATKLYWHATTSGLPSGTLPTDEQSTLTPDANDFEGSRTTNRLMNTSVGVSQANLTNTSTGDTSSHNYYITRFVSPLIYQAKVDANTWTVEYGAKESNAAANFPRSGNGVMYVNCYVWKPSTGTKIGTILDGNSNTDGEESGTSQAVINFTFAGAAVTGITPGDAVIVYEVWAQVTQGNSATRTQDFYYDGTTENSTSNEAAFLSTPENLEFTQTAGNASIITSGRGVNSTANTTQYWNLAGKLFVTTTEAEVQIPIRKAGNIKKLTVDLITNSVTGNTTFTVRKNGVDTSLVATATTTGAAYWEDLTNTVTFAAGDKISLKSIPGAATNTFQIASISIIFEPTDPTETVSILATTDVTTSTTNNGTAYFSLNGSSNANSGVEARSKIRQKIAGTYSNMFVYVQSNARTTNTTFKTRKNGADGNLSITFAAGETGLKEYSGGTDTVVDGDDYNLAATTGSGTENIVWTLVGIHFTSLEFKGILVSCSSGQGVTANTTTYTRPGIDGSFNGTESFKQMKIRLTTMIVSNLVTYVHTGDNTVTANSTIKTRKNATNGNLVVTYASSEDGLKSDTSNSDSCGSNDLLAFEIAAGATGTSINYKSITIYYHTGRISLARIIKYHILGRISLSRIYKYHIQARVALSRIYKYHIQSRVSLSRTYLWDLIEGLERISKEQIYKWNINARISLGRIYKYNIIERISLSRVYKYHIQGRVSLSQNYLYHVLGRISLSRIYKYNLLGRISLSRSYKWNILERISLSRVYKYHIANLVSLSRVYKYNILSRVSLAQVYLYNVLERISLSRNYLYHVVGRTSLARIYKYHIVGRVSLPSILKYNIIGRISLSQIYKYHLQARVSLSQIYKYDIIGRISLAQTYLWDVIAGGLERISKEQIYKWDIIGRISLNRIYKYNVLARASLSRVYKYNLLGRISLARQYLYHIQGRVSVSRIYKWNLLNRISLSRIYKYHITTLVSKASIFKYNVIGRISLSRIYKYNLIGRISKTRTYKWNILQRVSKSRTYIWRITNRVSKSTILKWNVLKKISRSITFRWDFARIPSTRDRSISGNTESKQRYPKQFDRIRSYLHRPQPTRGKRTSKHTRG